MQLRSTSIGVWHEEQRRRIIVASNVRIPKHGASWLFPVGAGADMAEAFRQLTLGQNGDGGIIFSGGFEHPPPKPARKEREREESWRSGVVM